jgi:hypothetical protein
MDLKNVKIIHIGELKQITDTYKKVEFVVELDGQYKQEVVFETSGEKADKFLQYNKVGNFVDIDYNLRGRSYLKAGEPETNRRWFNSLDAWKIFKAEGVQSPEPNSPNQPDASNDEDPEMPF